MLTLVCTQDRDSAGKPAVLYGHSMVGRLVADISSMRQSGKEIFLRAMCMWVCQTVHLDAEAGERFASGAEAWSVSGGFQAGLIPGSTLDPWANWQVCFKTARSKHLGARELAFRVQERQQLLHEQVVHTLHIDTRMVAGQIRRGLICRLQRLFCLYILPQHLPQHTRCLCCCNRS